MLNQLAWRHREVFGGSVLIGNRGRTASFVSSSGCSLATWLLVFGLSGSGLVRAEVITLKSGLQLEGRLGKQVSVNENAQQQFAPTPNVKVAKIVLVDDGLRRSFVSSDQVRTGGLAPDGDAAPLKIRIAKRVAQGGRRISSVGPIIQVTPFDEYGNRIFSMRGPRGQVDVVQGITEITPLYARVQGLTARGNSFEWDMRISTASIPRQTLTQILLHYIIQSDMQDRLRVVTLYIQAQRYQEALKELDRIIADFPDVKDLQKQRQRLNQLVATNVLQEIELRRDAGQHRLVRTLLQNFPKKDVAGEILLQVGDVLAEYEKKDNQGKRVLELLKKDVQQLKTHKDHELIDTICSEIMTELDLNNLARMADYLRLADDKKLTVEKKVSLAISGWLLGSGEGIENLAQSLSLVQVRDAVRDYLRSDAPGERDGYLRHLQELEGSTPANIAKIIAHMKPPIETEFQPDGIPGLTTQTIPGVGGRANFRYVVQLPPEYDPYRRYPCIVTLHAEGATSLAQVDWWAGQYDPNLRSRVGQATRYGYIVVAPDWAGPKQSSYDYALPEHAAVLSTLRDACRRFSIDTDRVFLSGHSAGGDAAWDIGLAHPDLWAGILPIVATSGKYVSRYWPNGRNLPMYFVGGELDGNEIATNSRDLDRYLRYSGFDVMYVEYQGRGHEHFHDEIQRMFKWMGLHLRDFFPKEFECVSMRPWDQFFWWLELSGFPDRSMVLPASWPQPKAKEARTEAHITDNNNIWVQSAASDVTIFLAPELIDFNQRISVNGHKEDVVPKVDELLEDVRTRCDRQHPFWTVIRSSAGRKR